MADPILRRTPARSAPGSGWSIGTPFTALSLRANLDDAQALLAAAALEPQAHAPVRLSLLACRALSEGEWSALWLGPDEQLLVGPDADGPAMAERIGLALRSLPHSLVDVSHRQCALELRGPMAAAMLNTGCPLDLALETAPIGFCTRTVFAKAEIVLWRRAESSFQVQCWRSFLPYVTGLLAIAAGEHGQ